MSSDFVTRTELDDLLVQQRRKIERLEQQAAEARESIVSFRQWSIIVGSRVSQCETWIVGLMPPEQRVCVTGGDVEPQPEREPDECAADDAGEFEALDPEPQPPHLWKVGQRCFVVRLRSGAMTAGSFAVSTWYRLEDAQQRLEQFVDEGNRGEREVMHAAITVATVARVDVLVNLVTQIDGERQLTRDDEELTPVTSRGQQLLDKIADRWIGDRARPHNADVVMDADARLVDLIDRTADHNRRADDAVRQHNDGTETTTPATPKPVTDNVVLKCGTLDDLLG